MNFSRKKWLSAQVCTKLADFIFHLWSWPSRPFTVTIPSFYHYRPFQNFWFRPRSILPLPFLRLPLPIRTCKDSRSLEKKNSAVIFQRFFLPILEGSNRYFSREKINKNNINFFSVNFHQVSRNFSKLNINLILLIFREILIEISRN